MFYFHPEIWGNDPISRAYFSDGLVQPPTSYIWLIFYCLNMKYDVASPWIRWGANHPTYLANG